MVKQVGFTHDQVPCVVKQGSLLTLELTLLDEDDNPIDVSGKTFTGQIRSTPSSSTVVASWTFDMSNASQGIVLAILSGASTSSLTLGDSRESKDSQFVYDIRYEVTTNVFKYVVPLSPITIEPRVTR